MRANAYSGLFFFRGSGSTATSNPLISDVGYFNPMPYGRKSDFSYALELQAKLTSQKDATYNRIHERYPMDIGPRLQLNAYHNRMGLLVGYSVGLQNPYHYDNPYSANNKAYANYLYIGVSYRIK